MLSPLKSGLPMQSTHKYWTSRFFCNYLQSSDEDSGLVSEISLEIQNENSLLGGKVTRLRESQTIPWVLSNQMTFIGGNKRLCQGSIHGQSQDLKFKFPAQSLASWHNGSPHTDTKNSLFLALSNQTLSGAGVSAWWIAHCQERWLSTWMRYTRWLVKLMSHVLCCDLGEGWFSFSGGIIKNN